MLEALESIHVMDGDRVAAEHVGTALTAGGFIYGDGATQVFQPSGATTYVARGQPTQGEWHLDEDGHFCSFWPPTFRACYDLRWIVEDGSIVGVRFIQLGEGASFDGRYR